MILPYGTRDLDPAIHRSLRVPGKIRCYVRGCTQELRPPARGYPGDVCPVHGIRCHHSGDAGTYSYTDVSRNIIVAAELLANRVVGHPFKYESGRLHQEKSEDALTWNVLRSFQQGEFLGDLARCITQGNEPEEPRLYLWGLCLTGDSLEPWDLLIQARSRFEDDLPVKRPYTEPDIGLYLPGRYLVLIEAKFTSGNPTYGDGPRRDATALTKQELLNIYQAPGLEIIDHVSARDADRVHYQMWRNTVFAEWMARVDAPETRAYFVSLTRVSPGQDDLSEFKSLVRSEFSGSSGFPVGRTSVPVS